MIAWSVCSVDQECGHCQARIPPGTPVAVLTVTRRYRCVGCARVAVDWGQVAAARAALEPRENRQAAPRPSSGAARRVTPIRRPLPASAVAGVVHDPRAAAAGDRDD